ncbi:unnamed protein product [Caenorhabditis angaria]|uniref:Domain of unknown function DX domain-containing protein n=1 Tax=Caenorhabditis angaria TaxID=860376 RepID=A0A9P1IBC6_9PELO|nr:unnamed protein product [Caenorhabditis angaria]
MLPIFLCLLFLFSLEVSSTSKIVPFENWQCGFSHNDAKKYTYGQILRKCPSLLFAYNQCCAALFDCYRQQHEQSFCDSVYCGCLRTHAYRIPTKDSLNCVSEFKETCVARALLGFWAYNDAPTWSKHPEIYPISIPEFSEDYMFLYQTCPQNSHSLYSCSVQFDTCEKIDELEICAIELCHCILDLAEKSSEKCGKETNKYCEKLMIYSSKTMESRQKFNGIIIFLGSFTTVFLISGASFWIWKKFKKNEEIKKDDNFEMCE